MCIKIIIKTIKRGASDTMKFILFLLSFLYVNNVALAEEKVKADYVAKQVDKYKEECFNKYAFPKGIDNYSMYNDDIKEGDFRYHQCLKNIIIEKIKEISSTDEAALMIADLNKIQDSFSDFYWRLYNRKDSGVLGRGINDAVLGRRFEDILEDILYYKSTYYID